MRTSVSFGVLAALLCSSIAVRTAELSQALVAVSQENEAKARGILVHAQQAAGGRAKLESIRDFTRTAVLEQTGSGGNAQQILRVIAPRVIHLTSDVGGAKIAAFFDGTRSWAVSPLGSNDPLPPWQAAAADLDLFRQIEFLLLSDRLPQRTLELLERAEIHGRQADGIRIADQRGSDVKPWIDAGSGGCCSRIPAIVLRRGSSGADLFATIARCRAFACPSRSRAWPTVFRMNTTVVR